ncbi:hypothetical protein B7463_g7745, partial [Scytalidium lignicola]
MAQISPSKANGTAPFPRPPVESIVNGHVESRFSTATGCWSEPEFVEDPILHIHGLSTALNFAQQIFEGMKAFRTPKNEIQLFRPKENAKRMMHSAKFVSIPPVPVEHFLKCVHLAVGFNSEFVPPHEASAALYCRPMAFASAAQLGLSLGTDFVFCVYVLPVGQLHGAGTVDALVVDDFDRAAPEGTGSAKVGGNYGPVLGLIDKARQAGYGITLHLDSKTRSKIDEFSTSAFVGVKQKGDSYTLVVSDSQQIVKSVTCSSVCELAKSFGWEIEVRAIPYEELPTFSEVFAAGTAAVLVPIRSIERKSTSDKFVFQGGSSEPGPCYSRLYTTLKDIQRGIIPDSFGWGEIVQDPKHDRQVVNKV